MVKDAYTAESRDYWKKMAALAEAENRKMDAMGYYLNALDIPRPQYYASEKEDETVQKARQLWKELGGTDEGWSVWTTEHMPPPNLEAGFFAWNKLDKPLPDFSLPDLSGRTWRLDDLKGKVTFMNVWATWCGPCQAEMPFVQKLYDNMKDNPDVQVLTLNIDENPGLIAPYLRDSNYTFPIIPGTSLCSCRWISSCQFPGTGWSIQRRVAAGTVGLRSQGCGVASIGDQSHGGGSRRKMISHCHP